MSLNQSADMEKSSRCRFQKDCPIGMGSYGSVFKGSLVLNNKKTPIAIKQVEIGSCKWELKSLIRELRVLSNLDHPHILKFFVPVESDGKIFLLTELCCGDMSKIIKTRSLYETLQSCDIVSFMFELLSGLAYLHANCIVHR